MNRISPAELTRDIAGSAAAQMVEYDYTEKMKNCGERPDVTACVPRKIAEKAARDISTETAFVGIEFSAIPDMPGFIHVKQVLKNENN